MEDILTPRNVSRRQQHQQKLRQSQQSQMDSKRVNVDPVARVKIPLKDHNGKTKVPLKNYSTITDRIGTVIIYVPNSTPFVLLTDTFKGEVFSVGRSTT